MPETNMASGMSAWERHDWATAYEELLPLLDAEESEPEHLEALAESAWWCEAWTTPSLLKNAPSGPTPQTVASSSAALDRRNGWLARSRYSVIAAHGDY